LRRTVGEKKILSSGQAQGPAPTKSTLFFSYLYILHLKIFEQPA